ncbi:hypothetical protein RRG08_051438 [Elysia crispata]|uniref:Uncharacterized protein n=1 Tax=Elysia crispata TaxID=231223 RepID=A0AAE1B3H4_9GAST|nr:hypothetical protein RRG08_051438 [Elysia crispata]
MFTGPTGPFIHFVNSIASGLSRERIVRIHDLLSMSEQHSHQRTTLKLGLFTRHQRREPLRTGHKYYFASVFLGSN